MTLNSAHFLHLHTHIHTHHYDVICGQCLIQTSAHVDRTDKHVPLHIAWLTSAHALTQITHTRTHSHTHIYTVSMGN